jgi:hypothetical protein
MQLRKMKSDNNRDFLNFVNLRQSTPKDDAALGDFLLEVFESKQKEINPLHQDNRERVLDLLNVKSRRENGAVMVFEMGYQIVATFSLIHQDSSINEAWLPKSTLLRCVAVKKDFRQLDLSKVLLKEADRISFQFGAQNCCLHVNTNAPNVAKVYEKHGYQRDDRGDHIACGALVLGYCKSTQHADDLPDSTWPFQQ